jgi:hypothetical protein
LYRVFSFLLFLFPGILIVGCDLFNASLVDYFLDNNEIVKATGCTVKTTYAVAKDGTILIPPDNTTTIGVELSNPRNFTVRQELLGAPQGKLSSRQISPTEIEVTIAGASEGDAYDLTLTMQSSDGLRDFPSYSLGIRCVSFETALQDFTVDGTSLFNPAQDSILANVPYPSATVTLGGTTEHPEAAIELHAGTDASGDLLAAGKHTLTLLRGLEVGDNHFYLTITAPSSTTQSYALIIHRASASENAIEDFYFTVDAQNYGLVSGAVSGSGSMNGSAIMITVPYGTETSSLSAETRYTGNSISPDPASPRSYADPVEYIVTAADGIPRAYTVTVDAAKIAGIEAIRFTDGFASKGGADISGDIKAAITSVTGTDSLGTAIVLAAADYSVDPLVPAAAGVKETATLWVRGAMGSTGAEMTKTFEVYIKSDARAIRAFYFTIDSKKYGLGDGVEPGSGRITGDEIVITVPYGTALSSLSPDITVSAGASVNPASGAPWGSAVNPHTYRVTAEDGTPQEYKVTVNTVPGITISVTIEGLDVLTFDSIPFTATAGEGIIIKANRENISSDSWYIDISGPINLKESSPTPTSSITFFAPSTPGFYNINVIARVGGVDYSGSFGLIVR